MPEKSTKVKLEETEKKLAQMAAALREAEEKLAETEDNYRMILDGADLMVSVYDLNGICLLMNRKVADLFGGKPSDFMGKSFSELHPEKDKGFWERVKKVVASGHIKEFDDEICFPKGSRWLLTKFYPVVDAEGVIYAVQIISQDITGRKRTETILRESEARFKGLVEQSPFSIHIMDPHGKTVKMNRASEALWGVTLEDLEHYNMLQDQQLKDLGLMPYIEKGFSGAVSILPATEYDAQQTFGKGRKRWVEARIFPVKDGTDHITNIILVHLDVTDRVLAEKALRESEKKYRLLIENANDAVYIFQDQVLTFANKKSEKMMGYAPEELAKMRFVEMVHPDDRERVRAWHSKRLSGEESPSLYSFRIIRKSGEELSVELNTVLISWEGRPATLNFLRDVTAQKSLETQLRQAQKMEAIGTLAGGIAHDFNNLLMAVQGRVSMMLMDKASHHPDAEHLKGIEGYVRSAAALTGQLLSFSKGAKCEVKPTDLNKLVKNEIQMFGRTKKEITICEKCENDLWTVSVDQVQIQQVLLNLFVNAWQAMPGGGTLNVATENAFLDENRVNPFSADPGRYVRISVADTGIGMDKATRERIFDPFFTTKEMGRGTGLGLASVYGIIKNHSGFIEVQSEKGHGTAFHIYLPASDEAVMELDQATVHLMTGSETVLFVDDEDIITEFAASFLGRLGYKVLVADGGRKALEIYARNKEQIDIVVLDMVMPDMSGGETFAGLKAINPDVKVLLSSGYSIDGQAAEILSRGCNDFIQKPHKIEVLSQKLRRILDGK